MFRSLLALAIALVLSAGVSAQPTNAAEEQERTVSPYLYLGIRTATRFCSARNSGATIRNTTTAHFTASWT